MEACHWGNPPTFSPICLFKGKFVSEFAKMFSEMIGIWKIVSRWHIAIYADGWMIWHAMTWLWHAMIYDDMWRYGMTCYDMIWYGIIWNVVGCVFFCSPSFPFFPAVAMDHCRSGISRWRHHTSRDARGGWLGNDETNEPHFNWCFSVGSYYVIYIYMYN